MHTLFFFACTLIRYTVCSPEGAVRLVNGSSHIEGRVEYCSNGVWGTVSSDGFDSFSLQVVCQSALARKLGHLSYGCDGTLWWNCALAPSLSSVFDREK